ncbi:hypothetical protein [Geothrix sp. SG200]|uniref:hypothetical protein n=1 Tax=Geothrix sp. SG200 TaxID=2922865 RepID=UPI001FAB8203|nr:hypothetical protein [Geothrix sp. SG200]
MSNEVNPKRQLIASIVKIINEYTLVINKGSDHGLKIGDQFLVYFLETEELFDPETNENLGRLEILRGTGSVIHLQEKIATIKSNRTTKTIRTIKRTPNQWASVLLGSEIVEQPDVEVLPFEYPALNDKAKLL